MYCPIFMRVNETAIPVKATKQILEIGVYSCNKQINRIEQNTREIFGSEQQLLVTTPQNKNVTNFGITENKLSKKDHRNSTAKCFPSDFQIMHFQVTDATFVMRQQYT